MAAKYQMNLSFPEHLVERLDDLAEEMDVSRSELVRLILSQYLCGKLELRIEDQQAADRLTKMVGRWPRGERKKKSASKRK